MLQPDMSLVKKLRKQTLVQLAKHQDDLQQYIPVQACLFRDEAHPFNLLDDLQKKFISNPKQDAVLLLGDSGAGKTVTGQMLIKMVCENTSDETLIPLWVPLLSISDPSKHLLKQHLRDNLNLANEEIELLLHKEKEAYRWFVVLDGYDEINTNQNLAKLNGWQDYRMQLIITCRHDLFHQEDIRLHSHQFALTQPLVLYQVCPFDQKQMGLYIEQYVKIHNTAWSKDTYLSELEKLPGLMALLTNPFILSMAMSALPALVAKYHSENNNNNVVARVKLTRHALYDTFLKQWFMRQVKKLEAHAGYGECINQMLVDYKAKQTSLNETEDVTDISLVTLLEDYSRNLAQAMFAHRVEVLEYHPGTVPKKGSLWVGPSTENENNQTAKQTNNADGSDDWQREYVGESLPLKIQRKGCPLKKVGPHRYAFFHKSLQEFLAAEHLFNGALVESWILTGQNLNSHNLLEKDPAIIKNLAERVEEDPAFKQVLFSIVETSKYEPSVWKAAANAMTILNRARVSFSGMDLRRVRIGGEDEQGNRWGADLSGSVCDGTDFSEADLRYVNFTQAHLSRARLNGVCMDGVIFGEDPWLKGYDACYSPDGKHLVVAKEEDRLIFDKQYWIFIYEVASQRLIQKFKAPSSIDCFAFHPAENQLATGGGNYYPEDYVIRLWDISQGRCKQVLKGHTGIVRLIAYHPNGQQLASVQGSFRHYPADCSIHLWNIASGRYEQALIGHKRVISSIHYRPDGQQLASGSEDDTIRLWDVANGHCVQVLDGHSGRVTSIHYRPDGQQLASGSSDKTIRLWEVASGHCEQVLEGHTGSVKSIHYRPDGQQLASGGEDKTIRLWNVSSGHCVQVLEGHSVYSIQYRPDGQQLVSGSHQSWDGIRLWDVANGRCEQMLEGQSKRINSLHYSPDGHQLASVQSRRDSFFDYSDYSIRLWNIASGRCEQVLEGHIGRVTSIHYRPDGHQLASGGKDKTIRLWDVSSGRCEQVLEGHTSEVKSICYRPDGHQLASRSEGKTIRLWDVSSGHCVQVLNGHTGSVYSISYCPDGHQLASGSEDKTIRLWDVLSGHCMQVLEGHTDSVYIIRYRPDGHQLASGGGKDKTIRLWDVLSGHCMQVLEGHTDSVYIIHFRPDGQQLASKSDEKTIRLWDVSSGRCEKILKGHTSSVNSIYYRPNSQQLASAGDRWDKTIRLWNSANYQCMTVWQADRTEVSALTWSPDGMYCASGHDDGAINIWEICTQGQSFVPQLVWRTRKELHTEQTQLQQVTGLTSLQQSLLQQRGPSHGEVSTRETTKVLQERNGQVFVPEGVIKTPWLKTPGECQITPDMWLVSLVRKRKIQDQTDKNNNNQNQDAGCHAFLLIQGITETHFTYLKEIHFFLDGRKPTYFFQTVGWGLIQIRDKSPWDLQAQASKLVAKTWQLTKAEAEQLLANVEVDQKQKVGYVKSGRGMNSYSCLTWCEMQLERIGLNLNLQPHWYDFICAIPTNHLPDPNKVEPTTKGPCLLM